jgi:hypothetical protein
MSEHKHEDDGPELIRKQYEDACGRLCRACLCRNFADTPLSREVQEALLVQVQKDVDTIAHAFEHHGPWLNEARKDCLWGCVNRLAPGIECRSVNAACVANILGRLHQWLGSTRQ